MTRFQRGRGSSHGRSGTRDTSWSVGPQGSTGAISVVGTAMFPTNAVADVADKTLIRTRGELLLVLNAADSGIAGFNQLAFGMCIVSQNAAGIGVTAVPDPIADIAWEGWFVYWTGALVGGSGTEADFVGGIGATARIVIDSKAMRKLNETDVVVGVLGIAQEVATATMIGVLNTRLLSKVS